MKLFYPNNCMNVNLMKNRKLLNFSKKLKYFFKVTDNYKNVCPLCTPAGAIRVKT